MRKVLFATAALVSLSGAAFAADLPNVKGPPVFAPPPPAFTWTGFYIGTQVGYQWGTTFDPPAPLTGLPNYTGSGVVGGAHLGFNYQINQFVLGIEGDVDGSSYYGATSIFGAPPDLFSSITTRIPVEGSIRGRVGYAFDRLLLYATGGLAIADINNSYGTPGTPAVCLATPSICARTPAYIIPGIPPASDSIWATRIGWTVGGGVEYAFDPHWIIRAEYRYTDFGPFNENLVNTYPGFFTSLTIADSMATIGFSYKF